MHVECQVTAEGLMGINIYVVDSVNFDLLSDGDSFYAEIREQFTVEAEFQFEAQSSDMYYVVFSNTFSPLLSKTVDIEIKINPTSYFGEILVIILVSGGIIAAIVLVKRQSEKEKFTADFQHHTQPLEIKPDQPIMPRITADTSQPNETSILGQTTPQVLSQKRFCTGCGQELKEGEKFCPHCGNKV